MVRLPVPGSSESEDEMYPGPEFLAIQDIPASTVLRWEQKVNRFARSWVGAGHTLSRIPICL